LAETTYTIGAWTFFPRSHELARGGARVRLEHRTASVLELLCEHRGEVVSREALRARIWGDRHVSGNSLPTAIHDLRRALGDDAKRPIYLETVSKSGYRLFPAETATAPAPSSITISSTRRSQLTLAALLTIGAFGIAGIAAIAFNSSAAAPRTVLLVGDIINQTGDPALEPVARASETVLLNTLSRRPGILVRRASVAEAASAHGDAILLSARLVLWTGQPDVVMVAEDARTSTVIWSDFAFGPEPSLPRKIEQKIDEFVAVAVHPGAPPARPSAPQP
jgi:DNA-binding winged helix-turn-helix (wHTH) protein